MKKPITIVLATTMILFVVITSWDLINSRSGPTLQSANFLHTLPPAIFPSSTTLAPKQCPTKTATGCNHGDETLPTYTTPVEAGKSLSNNNCEGEGVPYKLGHLPMDEADFSIVLPYGMMIGGHVTPIDHQYFSPRDYNSPVDSYPVYAMADSTIVAIQQRTNTQHPATEYNIRFAVTCTFLYYYDLVTSLAPDIQQIFDDANKTNSHTPLVIKVKEGQLIGHIGGRTLDFAVYDTTKTLPGFVVPQHYGERWKIYVADPLNYYTDSLKQIILSRYVRTVEPLSGKIDYDIDGKLIGNWFLEGSSGYGDGSMGEDYFKGHLAFAPDNIDPTRFIISIGSLYKQVQDDSQMQHMIANGPPPPNEVGMESGLVKYDLVSWRYMKPDGSLWDNKSLATGLVSDTKGTQHFGCVLVQMLSPRKIKFEVFQGRNANQVKAFDSRAVIYER